MRTPAGGEETELTVQNTRHAKRYRSFGAVHRASEASAGVGLSVVGAAFLFGEISGESGLGDVDECVDIEGVQPHQVGG